MNENILLRTMLYVPATRIDRIAKAFASQADAVIVDWEDAVEKEQKAQSRVNLMNYLQQDSRSVWLRINAADSEDYWLDVEACRKINNLSGIFLPKSESATQVSTLYHALGLPVIAIIETAKGMVELPQIAAAEGLFAMSYGCLDLANDLRLNYGSESAKAVYNQLCIDLVLHSRIHCLHAPIETIYPDFKDFEGLSRRVRWVSDMGFGGVMCIHPSQIAIVHQALSIEEDELALALKICAHADQSGLAAFQIEGKMIDLPLINQARALLAKHQIN